MPGSNTTYAGLIDVDSRTYDDAKTLWDSASRVYGQHLPRNIYWDLTDGLSASQRKEYLDTGFVVVNFGQRNGTDGHLDTIGSQTLWQYARDNPGLERLISGARIYGNLKSSGGHPAAQSDGSHIGDGSQSSSLDYSYSTDYRLQASNGSSLSYTPNYTASNDSQPADFPFLPPLITESQQFYVDAQDYAWNHSSFGETYKSTLLGLDSTLNIQGVFCDWEDTFAFFGGTDLDNGKWAESGDTYSNAKTGLVYHEIDPRFDQNSVTANKVKSLHYNNTKQMEARSDKIGETTSINGECSVLFDFNNELRGSWWADYSSEMNQAYNRKKSVLIFYGYNAGSDTPQEILTRFGWTYTPLISRGINLFDAWISPNIDNVNSGTLADPSSECWTIAQTIAISKLAMAMGSIKLIYYTSGTNTTGTVSHGWWSTLIAYDDMQQYYDIIKYGTNYLPPFAIARQYTPVVGEYPRSTLFYGRDSSNSLISSDVYIMCRTYLNQMLFYAASFDGSSGNISVNRPDGQTSSIPYGPFGETTLI